MSEDNPKFQFQGVFIPARIVHMMLEGDLSKTDILLMVMVKALTKHGRRGIEGRCWATNGYFARSLKVDKLWISKTISKLSDLGLILVSFDRHKDQPNWRFLEATWSDGGLEKKCKGGWRRNARGGLEKKCNPPLEKKCNHKKKEKEEEEKRKPSRLSRDGSPHENSAHATVGFMASSSSGFFRKRKSYSQRVPTQYKVWSRRLKDFAEYVLDMRISWNPSAWSNQFREIHEIKFKGDADRIDRALNALIDNKEAIKGDATGRWPRPKHPREFGNKVTWIESTLREEGHRKARDAHKDQYWDAYEERWINRVPIEDQI